VSGEPSVHTAALSSLLLGREWSRTQLGQQDLADGKMPGSACSSLLCKDSFKSLEHLGGVSEPNSIKNANDNSRCEEVLSIQSAGWAGCAN